MGAILFLWHNLKQNIYAFTLWQSTTISKIHRRYFQNLECGTKEELIPFIDELNRKDKTIKFDCKTSSNQIEFLDTMVYKNQHQNVQTTMFHKSSQNS